MFVALTIAKSAIFAPSRNNHVSLRGRARKVIINIVDLLRRSALRSTDLLCRSANQHRAHRRPKAERRGAFLFRRSLRSEIAPLCLTAGGLIAGYEDLRNQNLADRAIPGWRNHARTRSLRRLLRAALPARHGTGLRALGFIQVAHPRLISAGRLRADPWHIFQPA